MAVAAAVALALAVAVALAAVVGALVSVSVGAMDPSLVGAVPEVGHLQGSYSETEVKRYHQPQKIFSSDTVTPAPPTPSSTGTNQNMPPTTTTLLVDSVFISFPSASGR